MDQDLNEVRHSRSGEKQSMVSHMLGKVQSAFEKLLPGEPSFPDRYCPAILRFNQHSNRNIRRDPLYDATEGCNGH